MNLEGLSHEFQEELEKIRSQRAEPNPPPSEPLYETEHYLESLHFRMAGIVSICKRVFDPKDAGLAECLAIFEEDVGLLAQLGQLLVRELERKLKKPQ